MKIMSGDDSRFRLLPDESIVLEVGESCVETAAKKAHRALTVALLEERAPEEAQKAIELLSEFLGAFDFATIRAEYPELAGGTDCKVKISRRDGGAVEWDIQ